MPAAGEGSLAPADARVARLATRRRGVVTTAELRACGLTRHAITSRVRRGWLHRRHLGVYSVGHLGEIPLAREQAALLACGDRAALSHRSAAVLWGLLPADERRPVDVVVPRERRAAHEGVRAHHASLPAADVVVRQDLRVTTPLRTIVDLAAVLPPAQLAAVVAEAQARRLVRPAQLAAVRGRRGAAALRATVEAGPRFTRSEAERRLLALVRRAGLPLPETNVRVAGLSVDALWRRERLVVEIDGFAFHGHREAFERDRRRDQILLAAGFETLRITWRQLTGEPERIVALLAVRLAGR